MLVLIFIAFFSTIAFYRRGKQVGVSPGRAASLPFIVLGIFLSLAYVGGYLIVYLGELTNVSSATLSVIGLMFNLLFVLAYLQFINRNWQVLNQTNKMND